MSSEEDDFFKGLEQALAAKGKKKTKKKSAPKAKATREKKVAPRRTPKQVEMPVPGPMELYLMLPEVMKKKMKQSIIQVAMLQKKRTLRDRK